MRAFLATPEVRPSTLSRRAILMGGAALSAATVLVAEAAVFDTHPDAELLAAFDEWKQVSVIVENLPSDVLDDNRKPYFDRINDAIDVIATHPVHTPEGVAVKLSYLFASMGETSECSAAIWYDALPTDDTLLDHRFRMLWSLIASMKQMTTAPMSPAGVALDHAQGFDRSQRSPETPKDDQARRSLIQRDAENLVRNGLKTGAWVT